MTPEQAAGSHEDDEDTAEIFAWFDGATSPDGVTQNPCRTCRVLGRYQRGPAYWLLRRHLRRMARP
jgi:hypothetical protein